MVMLYMLNYVIYSVTTLLQWHYVHVQINCTDASVLQSKGKWIEIIMKGHLTNLNELHMFPVGLN